MLNQQTVSGIAQLKVLVEKRRAVLERPIVVGVSGYAGSGKSTLVRALMDAEPRVLRMRGDDFLDPSRSHHRSRDWAGVERSRLVDEVLIPFREGRTGTFRRYDWSRRTLGEPEPLPTGDVLVVDLIGLFHPEALPFLDLCVWVETSLATAQERGMRRDEALGRDFSRLWRDVWVPNEIDFEREFSPRSRAEILFVA